MLMERESNSGNVGCGPTVCWGCCLTPCLTWLAQRAGRQVQWTVLDLQMRVSDLPWVHTDRQSGVPYTLSSVCQMNECTHEWTNEWMSLCSRCWGVTSKFKPRIWEHSVFREVGAIKPVPFPRLVQHWPLPLWLWNCSPALRRAPWAYLRGEWNCKRPLWLWDHVWQQQRLSP